MSAGERNTFVVFQARETTQDATYGTTVEGNWTDYCSAWAEVRDILPGRSESIDDSISLAKRPARIRVDEYDGLGVTTAMRIFIEGDELRPDRTLRIISGPAFVRNTRELEFVAEEITTEGQEP